MTGFIMHFCTKIVVSVIKSKSASVIRCRSYNFLGEEPGMKTIVQALFAVGAASALLGGCALYAPPPVYGGAPYSYYQPAPVYGQPAPVYVAPPVSFGLNFGYWGGGGWGHPHR